MKLNHSVLICILLIFSYDVSTSDYLVKQDASRTWGIDAEMSIQTGKKSDKSIHPHEFFNAL